MKAVITADIVNSTKLNTEEADIVLESLHNTIQDIDNAKFNVYSSFAIKRGDSIQGELSNARDALRVALILKTAVNRLVITKNIKRNIVVDIRIAIGIGSVISNNNINESSGEAYMNSGRTLDGMKKEKRTLAIKTPNVNLTDELETEIKLLEVIMDRWTLSSTNILYYILLGKTENEAAEILKITQSAINQGKKRGGWNAIENLLKRFETLMQQK